jgi:chromosomal replication initiation ATPase DnaA
MQEKSRGLKDVAFARQVAMYLMHVTFGGTYQDAGAPLGRERTTVAYACSLVEDCRDEIEFDRKLTMLEESLERLWALAQLKTRRVPVRDQAAA